MRFGIVYRGEDAGWVKVSVDARGMLFKAESPLHTSAVLRLYGLTAQGEPLRIGVLEPENGILHLSRRLTEQTLRTAKVDTPPEQYYLDDGKPGCQPAQAVYDQTKDVKSTQHTKEKNLVDDPLLEKVLRTGAASLAQEDGVTVIRAPFIPGQAHPLHFALTACIIEHGEDGGVAVLRQGTEIAPS